jgi:hypothetical protein
MESLGCTVFHPYKLGKRSGQLPTSQPGRHKKLFTHIDRSRVKQKAFERSITNIPFSYDSIIIGPSLNEAVGVRKKMQIFNVDFL